MSGRKMGKRRPRFVSPWLTTQSSPSPCFGSSGGIQRGRLVETCSIITTTPNALCADVHDRMPVILHDEAYDLWLDPGFHKEGLAEQVGRIHR
jgi:putative SOS response-associated peptidase YedK